MNILRRFAFLRPHAPALIFLLLLAGFHSWNLSKGPLDGDEWASVAMGSGLGYYPVNQGYPIVFRKLPLDKPVFTARDYEPRKTLRNVVKVAFISDNGHAIPYYALLHGWMKMVGVSLFKLRFLSVLLLITGLGVWYAFYVRATGKVHIALLALVILGLNGSATTEAQHTRFYAFAFLLAGLAANLTWALGQEPDNKSSRKNRWLAVLLGGAWGLMTLTHFFAVVVAVAQGCFLVRHRAARRWLLVAVSVMAATSLVWLFPYGLERIRWAIHFHAVVMNNNTETSFAAVTPVRLAAGVAANVATLAGFAASHFPSPKTWLNLLLALPAIALLVRALLYRGAVFQFMRLMLAAHLLLVLCYTSITGLTTLLILRYWFFVLPCSALLVALGLWKGLGGNTDRPTRVLAWAAAILLTFRVGYTLANHPRLTTPPLLPDPHEIAMDIAISQYQPGDTIVHQSWSSAQNFNTFFAGHNEVPQRVDSLSPIRIGMVHQGRLIVLRK